MPWDSQRLQRYCNDIYIRAVFDEEFPDGEMTVRRGFYPGRALGVALAGLI